MADVSKGARGSARVRRCRWPYASPCRFP